MRDFHAKCVKIYQTVGYEDVNCSFYGEKSSGTAFANNYLNRVDSVGGFYKMPAVVQKNKNQTSKLI